MWERKIALMWDKSMVRNMAARALGQAMAYSVCTIRSPDVYLGVDEFTPEGDPAGRRAHEVHRSRRHQRASRLSACSSAFAGSTRSLRRTAQEGSQQEPASLLDASSGRRFGVGA